MRFFFNPMFEKILIAVCIIFMVVFYNSTVAQPAGKPNIIIVLDDDLGWADVGYNGNRCLETPNVDKLAQ